MPQIIIRHSKTGQEYEIDSADFRRGKHYHEFIDGQRQPGQTFEDAGFEVVSLADGSPYTGPLTDPPAERGGGSSS